MTIAGVGGSSGYTRFVVSEDRGIDASTCPECGGRGWIVEDDGAAGSARPCACRGRELVPRLLERAGIPERYRSCKLTNFQVDLAGYRSQLVRARSVAERYVDEFVRPDGSFRETGLLFVGPPGVGKTHLAAAVLQELVRRYRVEARFIDFTTLIYEIQATFDSRSPESKQSVMEPVMGAEVLVLDELGSQKPSAWVSEILYLILNTRYTRRLPTMFTTNYRLEAKDDSSRQLDRGRRSEAAELLSNRIPAMLVSRLWEMAQPLIIDSVDFRRAVKRHQHLL